jgi:hypothetical protein
VIEGNDLTELVRSAAQAMLDVAGQPVQIDTGQPISVTSRRLELKLECKVDGPFTIRRRMFAGRGLDTLSAPGVGGGAPDKAGTAPRRAR